MLPWCEDGKIPHQTLVFICEAVWLLLHKFSNHLGNPLGGIPLSVWSTPSYSLVLWLSRGPAGLGSRLHLHVQVWICYLSCVKKLAKPEYSFTVLICHGVPLYRQCPELTMYFECWLPRPQTMDTELLSQRLAECQYCLPEHMHGHAASALS